MEYGTNTDQRIKDAIDKWVPDADNVLVVLNELALPQGVSVQLPSRGRITVCS